MTSVPLSGGQRPPEQPSRAARSPYIADRSRLRSIVANSCLLATPIFLRIFEICYLTVRGLMLSDEAMSSVLAP